MEIKFHGHSCFELSEGDVTVDHTADTCHFGDLKLNCDRIAVVVAL
jgi:hypothetical protein